MSEAQNEQTFMNIISIVGVQFFLHNIGFILPCQPVMMTDPTLMRPTSPNKPTFPFVDVFLMRGLIMAELVLVATQLFSLNQTKNTSPLQSYP
jgi:hypothetical protein